MRLLGQIELYSRYEGILYGIQDFTKYKLPQTLPDDFIQLDQGKIMKKM